MRAMVWETLRVAGKGRFASRFGAFFLVCAGALCTVSPAAAQSASEKAAAEALFDEGVELLKAKKYQEACKKLESSQRVDPGIGTLLYLGECYKKVGRTASAWATFREAASKAEAAGESARARTGTERADAIEGSLSKVTFQVAEENRGIEGLEIQQAGLTVSRALWGTAVPVDPGEVTVMAQAPGYEPFEITVRVGEGPAAIVVRIPALTALPEEEQAVDPGPPAPAGATDPALDEDSRDPGSGRRTLGLALGGAGIVGLGLGSVFGVIAMNKDKQADEICGGTAECPAGEGGEDRTREARQNAMISTIAFAAGGALVASGIVIYLTAPKAQETAQLRLSPTAGGARLTLGARF